MQPKNEKSLAVGVAEIATAFLSHQNHGVSPEGVPNFILSIANAFKQAGQPTEALLSSTAIAATTEEPAASKQVETPVAAAHPAPAPVVEEAPAVEAEVELPAEAAPAPVVGAEQSTPTKARRKPPGRIAASKKPPAAVLEATEVVSEAAPAETVSLDPLEEKFGNRISRTPWMNMKPEEAIKPTAIICLIDGEARKMLHRHLKSKHGMSPDEYRAWFNLSDDYPMTAPGYSKEKSAYAKEVGLGTTAFTEKAKAKATPKLARRDRKATPSRIRTTA